MIYFPEGLTQADQPLIKLLVIVAETTHGVVDFSFMFHDVHMPRSYVFSVYYMRRNEGCYLRE